MKKRNLLLPLATLALLLSFGLTACGNGGGGGGGGDTPAGQSSNAQQEKITIEAAGGKKTLTLGESVQLTASVDGVSWESANEAVATVSQSGLVESKGEGTVKITAKKEGYKDGSISITVTKPAGPHPAEPTWPAECPALIDTSAWTAGATAQNAYNKTYTQITGADGSVGVKIAMADYDTDSVSTFDGDGKLGTNATDYVKFSVKAPKAGVYQMILKASCSSSGDDYPFAGSSSRGFDVKINTYEDQDNVYGSRLWTDANLDHSEKRPFIFALVQLSGPEFEDEVVQP